MTFIERSTPSQLEDSFVQCRRIVNSSGSSFGWSIRILPNAQRRAMEALYAYMRIVDDIADQSGSADDKKQKLLAIKQQIESDFENDNLNQQYPLFPAVQQTIHRFEIPRRCFTEVIEGMLLDIDFKPFQSLEQLRQYCRFVAGTVGIACVCIWGVKSGTHTPVFDPENPDNLVVQWIQQQALAVQITNIVRDIQEDALNNRVYIPAAILKRFSVNPALFIEQIQKQSYCQTDLELIIQDLIALAEGNYRSSEPLNSCLSRVGRRSNSQIRNVYEVLLQKIRQNPSQALRQRIHLSFGEKLIIAFKSIFR